MNQANARRLPGSYERIVAHNDFDGIVSASLCAHVLKIDRVVFMGPLSIARAQIPLTEKDVVCDLPYPVQCGLWFDHHEGNREELLYRGIDLQAIPGRFDLKPSCSRVIYDFFSESSGLPAFFKEAVDEADIIDSFSYSSMEAWRQETPGRIIEMTLKAHFPSNEDHFAYMRNLVQQLRNRPISEVAGLSFVQKQLKQYREQEGSMMKIIQEASSFLEQDLKREIILLDLTAYPRRPHLIKNLAFLVHPESLAVMEVYNLVERGVKSNHLGVSMALSIKANQGNGNKNVGEIMRVLNIGDGHPGAAAGTLRCKSKAEMLKKKKELLNQILKLWQGQDPPSPAHDTKVQGLPGSPEGASFGKA